MRSHPVFVALPFVVSALVAASGCSSSKATAAAGGSTAGPGASGGLPATSAVSGTRLRAKAITGGGAREVVAFHDTERNEDCTFQPAEDGRTRCLPPALQAFNSGFFTDAACKVATTVSTVPACSTDVKYTIVPTSAGCGPTAGGAQELRKLLDAGAPTYAIGPTGCSPVPTRAGSTVTRASGEIVPWTSFVEGTVTVVAGTPVSEKVLVASDGTRRHLAYRDDKLGVECTFRMTSDGVARCVPSAPAGEGPVMYSDLACTKPLGVRDYSSMYGCAAGTGTASNVWLEPSAQQCDGIANVYTLRPYDGTGDGESTFALTVDGQGQGSGASSVTCRSSGTINSNDASLRSIGANITASLPSSARSAGDNAAERLVPALVWPPALDTLAPGWHDTMNDVDCTFALASDGKMRCLPLAATATILFTDDACKSPSVVAVLGQPSCIGVRHYARVVSATCPPTTRIYAVGAEAKTLSNVSVMTTSGQCGKVTQAIGALDATEVDPTQFVEGVASVE